MTKIYCVGTYSSSALKGFVANPAQDRKQILEAMTASTGIKMIDFQITNLISLRIRIRVENPVRKK